MTDRDIIDRILMTQYKRLGRGPRYFDCWGAVCEVFRLKGEKPPYDPMVSAGNERDLRDVFERYVADEDWTICEPIDGCVAFFPTLHEASHAGVVIDGGILHTRAGIGPEWRPLSYFQDEQIEFAQWVR